MEEKLHFDAVFSQQNYNFFLNIFHYFITSLGRTVHVSCTVVASIYLHRTYIIFLKTMVFTMMMFRFIFLLLWKQFVQGEAIKKDKTTLLQHSTADWNGPNQPTVYFSNENSSYQFSPKKWVFVQMSAYFHFLFYYFLSYEEVQSD